MRQDQIIKVLKKLGSPNQKKHAHGVTANCPLHWKHEKGTDAHPSLFVYSTGTDRPSVARCHSCNFSGTLESLAWEVKRHGEKGGMMDLLEYIERAESGETELEDLGDSIPDYEDVPNYVKTNKDLQGKVRKKKIIHSQWIMPPDNDRPIQTMDYGDAIPLKQNDIMRMIKPFVGDVPQYWLDRGYTNEDARLWSIGTQKRFYYRKIKGLKEYYMDFGDRLLITIKDFKGNFVGWSARALTDDDSTQTFKHTDGHPIYRMPGSPKYMHCPNFNRNNYLYGEHLINRNNKVAFICEGFFDAINIRRQGFENALAVMGTAIGESQIKKLKSWFDTLVLFFDGDDAGLKAGVKAKEQLSKDFKVHIINPELYMGKDPGDMSRKEMDEAMMDSF